MAAIEILSESGNQTAAIGSGTMSPVALIQFAAGVPRGLEFIIVGSGDESRALREARECAERAWRIGADEDVADRTEPGSRRVWWSPRWTFQQVGPATLISTADADELHRAVQQPSLPSTSSVEEMLEWIRSATGMPRERIAQILGVSRQALYLWEHGGAVSSERYRIIIGVKDVLGRASVHYRTPDALRIWLETPTGSEGLSPAQLLEGDEMDRARALAMSTPSPVVQFGFAKRPVAEAFRLSSERESAAVPPDPDDEFSEFAKDHGEDVDTVMEE